MNESEESELRNPFPSPPSHYVKYTSHNLKLLETLKERIKDTANIASVDQHEVLSDLTGVPPFPLVQLEKPRVDWIVEEGHYSVFGDTWFVKETIPSLAELGGHQLYPPDPSVDRRPALLSIVRSLLVTYSNLIGAVVAPPPPPFSQVPPEWHRHVEWIRILAQNLMAAANDLRPVQARGNLERMMQCQLDIRREETRAIHAKCDELESRLKTLRTGALEMVPKQNTGTLHETSISGEAMTTEEVLRWAEEVT
ncbi:MED7 protein-domain-containing protein [Pisolithus sp. B1]|nr:MED7 protein-domain-containing protein [Pisolithus sp. B1]